MKVRVNELFYDRKEGKLREVGDEFTCSTERFNEIDFNLPGFLEIISEKRVSNEMPSAEETDVVIEEK